MSRYIFHRLLLVTLLASILSVLITPASSMSMIPVTSRLNDGVLRFRSQVQVDAEPAITTNRPLAVYVPGHMYYPVLQQPVGNPAFVSSQPDRVTQFEMAADFGTIGLLAHNNLAGESFFNLATGQEIILFYENGSNRHFRITGIYHYQALQPNSPYSNFIDLDSKQKADSGQVFAQIYQHKDRLVLQTCIASNGIPNWGRLFVTAEPIRLLANL